MNQAIAHSAISITKEDRRIYVFELADPFALRDWKMAYHDIMGIERVKSCSIYKRRTRIEFKQGVERKLRLRLVEAVQAIIAHHAEAM